MGNVTAKNIIDSTINSTISLNNDIIQLSKTEISGGQKIDINGCRIKPGAVVENIMNAYAVSIDRQKASITTNIDQNITDVVKQFAEAVSQNFSINLGKTDTENVTKILTNMAIQIRNNITNVCDVTTFNSQEINCFGNSVVEGTVRNILTVDLVNSCSQNVSIVSEVKQQLQQTIDQYAKSQQEDALTKILMFVAIILLVIFAGPLLIGSSVIKIFLPVILVILFILFGRDCFSDNPWVCKKYYRMYILIGVFMIFVLTLIKIKYSK